jgi:hypothetical protein
LLIHAAVGSGGGTGTPRGKRSAPQRHLVDADDLRPRYAGAPQLLAHVLLLERLDRVPLELQLLGDVFDGRSAAASPGIEREALSVAELSARKSRRSRFTAPQWWHATRRSSNSTTIRNASAGEVANPMHPAIVEAALLLGRTRHRPFF